MAGPGAGVQRLAPREQLQHDENEQVEHATAERIADGDIRRVEQRDGTQSRHELRQRCGDR